MSGDNDCALDLQVAAATRGAARAVLPAPDVLLFAATGATGLASHLEEAKAVPLEAIEGVPEAWRASTLHCGSMGEVSVWCLEDEPVRDLLLADAPWARAFPVWWAAASGAQAMVHASAGTSAETSASPHLVAIVDHINLSGSTPLTSLGESRLGPLFPDQTRVHDLRLRELAAEVADAAGLEFGSAVAACAAGPAICTPHELRWHHASGATVTVQDLAAPLIAASHAGLPTLALCAATDHAGAAGHLAKLVDASAALAPSLEQLIAGVARRVRELDTE